MQDKVSICDVIAEAGMTAILHGNARLADLAARAARAALDEVPGAAHDTRLQDMVAPRRGA